MRFVVLALPALLVTAAPAFAQDQVTTPTSLTATAVPAKLADNDPNKLICKTFDVTGSRLSKRRECHTRSEWVEIQAVERRELDKQQANRYKGNE